MYTLAVERRLLQAIVDASPHPLLVVDRAAEIRFANTAALTATDTSLDDLIGTPLDALMQTEGSTVSTAVEDALGGRAVEIHSSISFGGARSLHHIRLVPLDGEANGRASHVALFIRPAVGDPLVSERLSSLEYTDPTTGLLNRRSLIVVTDRELNRANRAKPTMAMLFVMLREFKEINQMHGHHVGDLLLENTGLRIREVVRKSDYVFRWEGTNMVVLLPELANPLDAALVAEKIYETVTVPYRYRDIDLAPGCYIGIATVPADASSADTLLNAANSAVIDAERSGSAYQYYDIAVHTRAAERLALRTALQRAFASDQLALFWQPIVSPDGTIVGAEGLIRWYHPELGLVGPDVFIELAEDTRLIAPIDKFALYQAALCLAVWREHGMFVTVNISASNLSDATLPLIVSQALSDAGLNDGAGLKLELTERLTISNTEYSAAVMHELTALGVEVWVDDFGTGQSSLSYLKRLPVTTVKVDKDFVADLAHTPADIDYLAGIIDTIRSRGKAVVIEGIGSEELRDLVRGLPVEYLQGYFFGRPMTSDDFSALIGAPAVECEAHSD